MSSTLELQEELRDLSGLIAKFKRELNAEYDAALEMELSFLEKRYDTLEQELLTATKQAELDVCKYRMFDDTPKREISINAVCNSCLDFQDLLSTVSGAIKAGPELKPRSANQQKKATELNFGYSMAGSVVIVMTIPNHSDLLQSNLDMSLAAISEMAASTSKKALLRSAKTLGSQSLKSMDKWIRCHRENNLGIDLKWLSKNQQSLQIYLQMPQIEALSDLLHEVTQKLEDHVEFVGILRGVETGKKNTFHFIADDGQDIKGTFDPSLISEDKPVATPGRYKITVRETYSLVVATDERKSAKFHLIVIEHLNE